MKSFFRLMLCGATLPLAAAIPFDQSSTAPPEKPAAERTPAERAPVPGVPGVPDKAAAHAAAVSKFKQLIASIDWKTEGAAPVGSMATIKVPAGYRFTGNAGTVRLMEAYGNLTNGRELGYLSPLNMGWFAVFEFENSGYVKDDEKNSLDADKIFQQLKSGQVEANKELTRRGMPTLELLGWQTPPFYNPQTHNLEWAIRLRGEGGGETINYKTKLLGRRGVMDVILVCDEAQLAGVVGEYQELLKGFAYQKEESYAAFVKGDKVAAYGLTGLIVGGGLLAAAKTGLLAKLWKPIVGVFAAIGAIFKRIFRGRTRETL